MTGFGISHGALSVVNAIGCGKGAAFGISLETRAFADLGGDGFSLTVNGAAQDPRFVEILVKEVCPEVSGARIETQSDIPIAKGLKSSSAAANAVLLAAADAAGLTLSPSEILSLNTECSKKAGVSVTGALDDAAACLLGGLVFCDNIRGELLERRQMPDVSVVIHVPGGCMQTGSFPADAMREKRADSERIFAKALAGDVFSAMYENGALVCDALQTAPETADRALKCGASAAGLSGTGPATGILVENERLDEFLDRFGRENCIVTSLWRGEP